MIYFTWKRGTLHNGKFLHLPQLISSKYAEKMPTHG